MKKQLLHQFQYEIAIDNYLNNKDVLSVQNDLNMGITDDDYSYTFPTDENYDKTIKKENLFRRFATVIGTEKESGTIYAVESNSKATIVAEGDALPLDADDFNDISFKSYKLASLSKIKSSFLQDSHFDIKNYLNNEFARRFGKGEEDILLNGTGVDEPIGLLNACDEGTTANSITYDSIIELYFSISKEYRKNAIFIMNDDTAMAIRKLKDENGQPLFNQTNDTIFGKKVLISSYMNDETKPIIFGDISYFWMIIRKPLSVKILTELYSVNNDIGYIGTERLDSKLVRSDAIKLLSTESEE